MWFLLQLARDYGLASAQRLRPVWLFLFFPTAYFLGAFYTEALFCSLAFGAFWFANRRRWLPACLLLAALTATRFPSLVVVIAIAVDYLAWRRFRLLAFRWDALCFLIAPLGFVAYIAFQWHAYHDPFAFQRVYRTYWSYTQFTPNVIATVWEQARMTIESIVQRHRSDSFGYGIPLAFWLAVAALWGANIKRLPLSYNVFMFGSLLLFVLNGTLISVNRYVLTLFPTYLLLARGLPESGWPLWLAGSAAFMATLAVAYAGVYWTA